MEDLDLHGVRLHEAESEVLRYVDRAYFEGELSCKIVHGLGVIASNIPAWLRSYPFVASFEPDPMNSGATIVHLKPR